MENRQFDKIGLRLGLVFSVLAVLCVIITEKPSAEFTISIVSLCCSLIVTVAAAVRMRMNNNKDE